MDHDHYSCHSVTDLEVNKAVIIEFGKRNKYEWFVCACEETRGQADGWRRDDWGIDFGGTAHDTPRAHALRYQTLDSVQPSLTFWILIFSLCQYDNV